ncbi:hypothetical protein [Streptomyces parvus]|uniref:hypothetical protein n=1 Tax=Streptomyces parvus TaxID=66428 RepID=UPI00362E7208
MPGLPPTLWIIRWSTFSAATNSASGMPSWISALARATRASAFSRSARPSGVSRSRDAESSVTSPRSRTASTASSMPSVPVSR